MLTIPSWRPNHRPRRRRCHRYGREQRNKHLHPLRLGCMLILDLVWQLRHRWKDKHEVREHPNGRFLLNKPIPFDDDSLQPPKYSSGSIGARNRRRRGRENASQKGARAELIVSSVSWDGFKDQMGPRWVMKWFPCFVSDVYIVVPLTVFLYVARQRTLRGWV